MQSLGGISNKSTRTHFTNFLLYLDEFSRKISPQSIYVATRCIVGVTYISQVTADGKTRRSRGVLYST